MCVLCVCGGVILEITSRGSVESRDRNGNKENTEYFNKQVATQKFVFYQVRQAVPVNSQI